MLTRKPTKTPSRVSDTLASSESGDAAASTPSKAPSARSLTLKREIEATTPAREVVHRSVSGEAPNTDADATKAPFADDVAFPKSALRDARVSIDSPLALSRELALATEKAAVAERVRVYETAESRAALAAVEKKLRDVERDLQKARREAAETARRAASLERTNARLQRELLNGGDGAGEKSGDALVDEKPKASKEDHKDRAHTVSSAALYVDVERLSAELTALAPSAMKVKVIASPERKNLAWIGGSIVGSNPRSAIFQSTCISKEMYDEAGPEVVHSKV